LLDHLPDLGVAATVLMLFMTVSRFLGVSVWMRVAVGMVMLVTMRVRMPVLMCVFVLMIMVMTMILLLMRVIVFMSQVNIELNPGDARFLGALGMQVVTLQMKLLQFVLKPMQVHSQIEQSANEHVAADAADEIEIKCLHGVQKG
jgi:hypothetical protein